MRLFSTKISFWGKRPMIGFPNFGMIVFASQIGDFCLGIFSKKEILFGLKNLFRERATAVVGRVVKLCESDRPPDHYELWRDMWIQDTRIVRK